MSSDDWRDRIDARLEGREPSKKEPVRGGARENASQPGAVPRRESSTPASTPSASSASGGMARRPVSGARSTASTSREAGKSARHRQIMDEVLENSRKLKGESSVTSSSRRTSARQGQGAASSSASQRSAVRPVTPPKVTRTFSRDDSGKSVRVYVVGICFIWGIVLGFLFHISGEGAPQKEKDPKKRPVRTAAAPKPGVESLSISPEDIEKQNSSAAEEDARRLREDVQNPIDKSSTARLIEQTQKEIDSAMAFADDTASTVYDIARLPKTKMGGVTSKNVSLPSFSGVRITPRPTAPASSSSPVRLPVISGPDLDF